MFQGAVACKPSVRCYYVGRPEGRPTKGDDPGSSPGRRRKPLDSSIGQSPPLNTASKCSNKFRLRESYGTVEESCVATDPSQSLGLFTEALRFE